jgi:hypothetical protein
LGGQVSSRSAENTLAVRYVTEREPFFLYMLRTAWHNACGAHSAFHFLDYPNGGNQLLRLF